MKKLGLILALVLSVVAGAAIGRYNLFPMPQLVNAKQYLFGPDEAKTKTVKKVTVKKEVFYPPHTIYLVPYKSDMTLYSDRKYFNEGESLDSLNLSVLQIPRHYWARIKIESPQDLMVYRGVSIANDSSDYHLWEKANLNFRVDGISCVFDRLVKKRFEAGEFVLDKGGPTAASPIFLRSVEGNEIKSLIINNQEVKSGFGYLER